MQKLSLWRPSHLHGLQCFLEVISYYNEDPPGFHGALYSSTFLFLYFPISHGDTYALHSQ